MSTHETIQIFIIEDDEIIIKVLLHDIKKQFAGRQVVITTFKTGEQCHLVHQKPDIAIIDYHLNGQYKNAMNGLDIVKMFKSQSPDTHLILFTGEESGEIIKEAISLGVTDYIIKNELMFLKLRTVLLQCIKLNELKQDLKKQRKIAISAVVFSGFLFTIFVALSLIRLETAHCITQIPAGEIKTCCLTF